MKVIGNIRICSMAGLGPVAWDQDMQRMSMHPPLPEHIECVEEQFHRRSDQCDLVALHIESVRHAAGVRERRRVQQYKVKLPVAALHPGAAIGALQSVLTFRQAIVGQVFAEPAEIGVGHIHTGGAACPT